MHVSDPSGFWRPPAPLRCAVAAGAAPSRPCRGRSRPPARSSPRRAARNCASCARRPGASVELRQDLVGGDALRTNAIGNLAILFADQTQIRVGRNSTLTSTRSRRGQDGNTAARAPGRQRLGARRPRRQRRRREDAGGRGGDPRHRLVACRSTAPGRTSLVVLEGVVELTNPQGSVTVRQGEGAVASIGQAPTKFVLVSPNDREQMLFYLTLRDAFTWLPATPLEGPALRAERDRVAAIPPERAPGRGLARRAPRPRSPSTAAPSPPRPSPRRARRHADRRPSAPGPTSSRRCSPARSGAGRRPPPCSAAPSGGLDPRRRVSAAYGRYVAASLADPKRVQPEPRANRRRPDRRPRAMPSCSASGRTSTPPPRRHGEAEKRFPGDARLAVFRPSSRLGLDRRDAMRAALERARAIDPDDPARAAHRRDDPGRRRQRHRRRDRRPQGRRRPGAGPSLDLERARPARIRAATRRSRPRRPSGAPSRSIPTIRSPTRTSRSYSSTRAASRRPGALIDKALALDPAFHVAYIARGRYLLQKGESAGAIESILAGSAANPAYSQGLLAAGRSPISRTATTSSPSRPSTMPTGSTRNDPVVSIVRTAFAHRPVPGRRRDPARPRGAPALPRPRRRLFAALAVNRQSGSYPAEAYRFIGLNEWARFYGDRIFDPVRRRRAISTRRSPARPRGLITERADPVDASRAADRRPRSFNLSCRASCSTRWRSSGRIGRIDPLRRPFVDAEIGGGP